MSVLHKGMLTVVVAAVLALALAGASSRPAHADWPPLTVDLSMKQEGNIVTAVIAVTNGGDFDTEALNVRGQVPKGARYVDSWAGSGRGFNAGIFDGNDVGWINASGVKAGARQGPFVYMFDISGMPPSSRSQALAWVGWGGKVPGSAVSRAVSIQNPSLVDVGTTAPAKPAPAVAGATAGVQATDPALKLDVGVGAPPAAGWAWAVETQSNGGHEVTESLDHHSFPWMFFAIKGSEEIGTAAGKTTIRADEAMLLPAGQDHTHHYAPETQVLGVRLGSADKPPSDYHAGVPVFYSGKALETKAGTNYSLRVREFALAPGERRPESTVAEPNFVYVIAGTLTSSPSSGTATVTEAGKVGILPLNVKQVISNEGASPLKFILVDLHE